MLHLLQIKIVDLCGRWIFGIQGIKKWEKIDTARIKIDTARMKDVWAGVGGGPQGLHVNIYRI